MPTRANDHGTWSVLPHDPVEELEDNLWRVEGSLVGMPLRRVMTVAKMQSGELVIYNPIALGEPEMQRLERFGRVAYLLVPNGRHRLDVGRYARRYPEAQVVGPIQGLRKVQEVVPRALGPTAFPSNNEVTVADLGGSRGAELYMTVLSGSRRTLVLADAIFNMPHLAGVQGFVLRYLTKSSGGPRVSRVSKMLLVKDKREFIEELRRLATDDLVRIIVAHHETITNQPAQTLRSIANSL